MTTNTHNGTAEPASSQTPDIGPVIQTLLQGNFEAAVNQFLALYQQDPSSARISLSFVQALLFIDEKTSVSILIERASTQPGIYGNADFYAGAMHWIKGEHHLALARFEQHIRQMQESDILMPFILAKALQANGRHYQAFQKFHAFFKDNNADKKYLHIALSCLSFFTLDDFDAQVYELIPEFIELGISGPETIKGLAISQIEAKYLHPDTRASAAINDTTINAMANDPVFIKLLREVKLAGPRIEEMMIQTRRWLQTDYDKGEQIDMQRLGLIDAIAIQVFGLEYIYHIDDDEASRLKATQQGLATALQSPAELQHNTIIQLLVYSMYESPFTLLSREYFQTIDLSEWPEQLQPTLQILVYDLLEELQLAEKMPSIDQIENEVSQRVKAQYEENPYPRWRFLTRTEGWKNYLATYLDENIPEAKLPFLEAPRILVAGCGTGQHALELCRLFPAAHVTAIDLSRRSLAYASKKASENRISNIEFYNIDILNIDQLGNSFDITEAVGSLQCMEIPALGLEKLVHITRHDGLIKLGLYSEAARQDVARFREWFEQQNLEPTLQTMREIRHAILNGMHPSFEPLMQRGDFYSASDCRDLMFHTCEWRHDIEQIQQMLDNNKLQFLGFFFFPQEKYRLQQFQNTFPGNDSLRDLGKWQAFETKHPETFKHMYQFICQKK